MSDAVSPREFLTHGGVSVTCAVSRVGSDAIEPLIDQLDTSVGVVLTSTFEYPGRYTRWDMGFVDPPLCITSRQRTMRIEALNDRGQVLREAIDSLMKALSDEDVVSDVRRTDEITEIDIVAWTGQFTEEERSRQPSVFSVLRKIIALFSSVEDQHLGLYGSFGYDLAFQFEPVEPRLARNKHQRDLVLFVPDRLVVVDHQRKTAQQLDYEFEWRGKSTANLARRDAVPPRFRPRVVTESEPGDHEPGEYAQTVETAIESFKRGDLFEVVPSQEFYAVPKAPPSEMFRRLRRRNPAPYGGFMNLGDDELLVSASPEMYVRVEGRRVETCPIAGTIARGVDVMSDADAILQLLNSNKDANELTMCTDVDRNDKSRVCDPATIKVLGRRQIEMYSRLIHTVDHVEGRLLPQFDGLDAFLAHTWAVTVTGAPKLWAMRFIEKHEKSPRCWYGGAIGALLFNGNINTGLTLRTIWIKDGLARVRAGATLLVDSSPEAEELETRTKASALLDAINRPDETSNDPTGMHSTSTVGAGLRVLLVDHEDSFVHTLAGYLRRTGASVTTVRVGVGDQLGVDVIDAVRPDLVVLSPGPGRPRDFHLGRTLDLAGNRPVFGVCLGLQGIVEYFGGALGVLDYPAHGRASEVTAAPHSKLFADLPDTFQAGRYHSLVGVDLPDDLVVTARTDDGVVMAVEHRSKPVAAVQFHPESMMTMRGEVGLKMIENFITRYVRSQ